MADSEPLHAADVDLAEELALNAGVAVDNRANRRDAAADRRARLVFDALPSRVDLRRGRWRFWRSTMPRCTCGWTARIRGGDIMVSSPRRRGAALGDGRPRSLRGDGAGPTSGGTGRWSTSEMSHELDLDGRHAGDGATTDRTRTRVALRRASESAMPSPALGGCGGVALTSTTC
jgi:hypothetical protein